MKKIIVLLILVFSLFESKAQIVTTLAGNGMVGFIDATGSAARFYGPPGLCVDTFGNIYVADQGNYRIRKITPDGVVSTFAGSTNGYVNGTGTAAKFGGPRDICMDSSGNFYVADWFTHTIRKISPTGVVTTLAGNGVAGNANGIGTSAQFNQPTKLAIDPSGNIYVVELGLLSNKIRKITPNGVVTTFAGSGVNGYVDGIGTSAQFDNIKDICVDNSGNLFVADNQKIRKITPGAVVTTFITNTVVSTTDLTIDSNNNIYRTTGLDDVRKISSSGVQTQITGTGTNSNGNLNGAAASALFNTANGICLDSQNNLYIADQGNNQIRKIIPCSSYITANITYNQSQFCKSLTAPQSVSLNGTGPYTGGSFSSTTGLTINSVTGSITPNTSTAGTYTVTYSTPSVSGCPSVSTTTQVTITAIPTASINYTGSPFCKSITIGQPVTLTGTGAYTGINGYTSTAGLSINAINGEINPSLSNAGTYTVTYTTPPVFGGCASISTTCQVTITAPPTASISYSVNGYCNGISNPQPVTITGTGAYLGGSYSAPSGLSINSLTGAVRPSLSTVGTYTVTYNIPASGGCASIQVTTIVTILPLNTVSSAPNLTICINTPLSPIIHTTTGATGIGTSIGLPSGVSASFSNNTITISGAPTTAGTFNYSIPLTGGCGTFNATGTIIVLGHFPTSISADGTISTATTITNGNAIQLQLNGTFDAQPNIQWTPNIGISSTTVANPLVYPSSTTTYTASFINSNGCPQSTSITVNVTPQPIIGNLSLNSPNTTPIGLFDTITVNVQLTNATDLYSLYMKLKGNAAVSQYLDYTGYVAGNLLGTSNVISTPPTVTNGVPDFGMTKVGPQPGYNGSGLFYTFTFVPKNVTIPDGTVFCFYLDDVSSYNSSATSCGLTNQGPICFTFTNQVIVWPGDLNKSNMVTTADLLPIGYFYNSTGPVRPNATIQWTGQPANLWGYNRSTMNGSAYKTFADSNGDGVINNADQAAIGFNMNQIHNRQSNNKPFGIAPNLPNNLQTLGNLIVTPNASIINGATLPQTVTFNVNLSNTSGLNSLFGISVNLIFDNTIFDLSTATINYTGSIFGNVGTDCLVMNYNSSNAVSVGLTRYLNSAINGNGLLFKVTLQTRNTLPSLLQTQVTSYVDSANNQLGEPLGISNATPIDFSIINNNLSLEDTTLNVFNLYPNPTKGLVYFSVGNYMNYRKLELKIFNTLGQLVDSISVKNSLEEIDAKNWGATGLYFVHILDENYNTIDVKKIILQ